VATLKYDSVDYMKGIEIMKINFFGNSAALDRRREKEKRWITLKNLVFFGYNFFVFSSNQNTLNKIAIFSKVVSDNLNSIICIIWT